VQAHGTRDDVAARIARAPLALIPIRWLAAVADRDTLDGWLADWERDGLLTIEPHLDAVHVPNRHVFALPDGCVTSTPAAA
jgi:hypothetical protein